MSIASLSAAHAQALQKIADESGENITTSVGTFTPQAERPYRVQLAGGGVPVVRVPASDAAAAMKLAEDIYGGTATAVAHAPLPL